MITVRATASYDYRNEQEFRRQLNEVLSRKQSVLEPIVVLSPSGRRFKLAVSDDGEVSATPV